MLSGSAARTSIARSVGLAAAVAVVAACRGGAPTPRDRVLAALPGDAVAVIVADGRALSQPRIRGVLDAVSSRWPPSLGCLADAAAASDAVAVAIDAASNITALVALAAPPRCPALSQRASGLWIATIGAGPSGHRGAPLGDPRFARARPYLETAAIAAASVGEVHLVAAAQPDPFDAWIAIDAAGRADAIAAAISAQIARLGSDPATAALASRVRTTRPGPGQVVVRLTGAPDGELASVARSLLAWAAPGRAVPPPPDRPIFACPAPAGSIRCSDGTHFRVGSLAADLARIVVAGRPAPVVDSGRVIGLRLGAAVAELGLGAGDLVVAFGGRLVTSRTALADWVAHARGATTLTIRRGAIDTLFEFAEH